MRAQYRLDLFEFDAIAAYLDLVVGTSGKFKVAVCEVTGKIPGLVKAGFRIVAKRISNEFFSRDLWTVQIATGEAGPADVQVSSNSYRQHL